MIQADVAVIGGGIVGLATAFQLTEEFPSRRVVVLEKEADVAAHQTGHNSGVLHSGIYYKPGSLKAINCRAGKQAMEAFCATEEIPFEICGKVIVAVNDSELPALERLYQRGLANGVRCTMIDPVRFRELEPHAAGVRAIHVAETGIVDYRQVCKRLAQRVREREGQVLTTTRVTGMTQQPNSVVIHSTAGDVTAKCVVTCAGLHCDRVTAMSGQTLDAKIVPFRGEYYALKPAALHLCRNLIYPVPDPKFPFLGVHFTRMIRGGVEWGPNAVLAFAREGYRRTDVNLADLAETLTYPGFLKMAFRHWRMGIGELWRSYNKRAFVRALQRLLPAIRAEDLESIPAGVRAQLVVRDGNLVDDVVIRENERVLNVGNTPSPAATASLNISKLIVKRLAARLT
ncbi:MAG TPA: L-2-hydroxyglutarate oxidase [Planctomycetaceae bacterium]|jgi:L-2-hydroxyglutarate oxidase